MNDERRLLLKQMLVQLEQLKARLHDVWTDEEASDYYLQSTASKETDQAVAAKKTIKDLEDAVTSFEDGCDLLRRIVAQS